MFILDELLSPIVTPFILYFKLRPRALHLVNFFRQFTVTVTGRCSRRLDSDGAYQVTVLFFNAEQLYPPQLPIPTQ